MQRSFLQWCFKWRSSSENLHCSFRCKIQSTLSLNFYNICLMAHIKELVYVIKSTSGCQMFSVEVCILQSRCCSISEALQWMCCVLRFYKKSNAAESFQCPVFMRETWHSVCVSDVMRGRLDRKECVCLSVYLSCALSLNFLISPASPVYITASVHTASLSLCLHPFALFQSLPCSVSL